MSHAPGRRSWRASAFVLSAAFLLGGSSTLARGAGAHSPSSGHGSAHSRAGSGAHENSHSATHAGAHAAPSSGASHGSRNGVAHSSQPHGKANPGVGVPRDADGQIHRSAEAKNDFKKAHPCPSTGKGEGACPGYVVDHRVPLKRGGADKPANMQWQTSAAAKAKDKTE
jgi:hypothetical protein